MSVEKVPFVRSFAKAHISRALGVRLDDLSLPGGFPSL